MMVNPFLVICSLHYIILSRIFSCQFCSKHASFAWFDYFWTFYRISALRQQPTVAQANLSILKQTQANQANDNVNDNDTANENDSASVNANAVTAQCAVGDPGRSLCSSRCTTRTQLPFSVSKAL